MTKARKCVDVIVTDRKQEELKEKNHPPKQRSPDANQKHDTDIRHQKVHDEQYRLDD